MNIVQNVTCTICAFSGKPEEFPDIETKSITKKDFDVLPETSKAILKKFGHDIGDMDSRIALHGSILICPNCGNTGNFDFNAQGG